MVVLTGDDTEHHLGGFRISTPGLKGRAEVSATGLPLATSGARLFAHALGNAGFTPRKPLLLSHTTAASGSVTISVDPPEPGNNALLLVHDSSGAVSWHVPDHPTEAVSQFQAATKAKTAASPADEASAEHATQSNSPAATPPRPLSFTLPSERFTTRHAGLLKSIAGRVEHFDFHRDVGGAVKALSVVEYPIGHLAAWGATKWIDHWDRNKHPAVIRWFPATGHQSTGEALSPTNWEFLSSGPVLLFIHGIFSSCKGAFGGIDAHTWAELHEHYNGRIIGYDHPSVSVGPEQNAVEFLDQIPDGIKLDVDIVCHSRGGLVARALSGQTAKLANAGAKVNVRKIVFAATPNGGSQITVTDHWALLISRISSLLTLPTAVLPPPVDEVATMLAGLLEVIKVVSVDTAVELPGLEDMAPSSDLYKELAAFIGTPPEYFAAASDFEPGPVLANLFNGIDDLARVVDAEVFLGVANDIAVPTNGVWDPANPDSLTPPPAAPIIPGFPVPDDHRLPIGITSVYWHCAYFEDQAMCDALVTWLIPKPPPGV